MSIPRSLNVAFLNAVLVAAAACHDSTAPLLDRDRDPAPAPAPAPVTIDSRNITARINDMTAVLDQPEVVSLNRALAFVDVLFGFGRFAPAGNTLSPSALLSGGGPLRTLAPTTSVLTNTIIDDAKGQTYVFGTFDFVPDPSATGAPENGVRVVMHGWSPTAAAPNLPLTRLGYADFVPVAGTDASVEALRARLVRDEGNAVLADYTIGHLVTPGGQEAFTVDGSAADGTKVVNFSALTDRTGPVRQSSISAPSRGIGVELGFVSASEPHAGTLLKLTITYDSHVVIAVFGSPASALRVDGQVYAIMATGTDTDGNVRLQFAKPDGTPFTQQETEGLTDLIETALLAAIRFHDLVWF